MIQILIRDNITHISRRVLMLNKDHSEEVATVPNIYPQFTPQDLGVMEIVYSVSKQPKEQSSMIENY